MTLAEIKAISEELQMLPPRYPQGALNILCTIISGTPSPNLLVIDEWCHKKWKYTEKEHGSLSNFLKLNGFPISYRLITKYLANSKET